MMMNNGQFQKALIRSDPFVRRRFAGLDEADKQLIAGQFMRHVRACQNLGVPTDPLFMKDAFEMMASDRGLVWRDNKLSEPFGIEW